MTRPIATARFASLFVAAALFVGCTAGGVTAINPLTGETRSFDTDTDVPAGWIVCASDDTCPAPRPCDELEETACLSRSDCSPVYVGVGAYPRECELPEPPAICDGEAYAGCTEAAATCAPADCGPAPLGATYLCPDGSVGGVTGRCIESGDGGCGWETRGCPTPGPEECELDACGPALGAPAYVCADGSIGGNTGRCLANADGTCGWELRECPPDECAALPMCDLLCPPGTVNPIDDRGCVDSCSCVPAPCSDRECGPAPGAPAYMCPDGSWGGNIGLCERSAAGVCGWVFRECPPSDCTDRECGSPPDSPTLMCDDGSIGGNTGRCLRGADGVCGWEWRECPDPCASIPMCDLVCPPGTHNPIDPSGCTLSCECVPDAR
jgi:hypothetical protein